MNENNHTNDSLKIDNWRYYFKKALIKMFLVFVIGLSVFLLFGLEWLVFYLLFVVSLIFGGMKYWEYILPFVFKKLNGKVERQEESNLKK